MRWICSILLLVLASCGGPRDVKDEWKLSSDWIERGPVRTQIQLRHDNMSILDQQDLHLTVQYPEGMDIEFPGFTERLEDYRMVPWRDEVKHVESGNVTLEKFVRFELFESGEQVLPPIRIVFSTGFGEARVSRNIDTPDLTFHIESINDPALVQAPLEDSLTLRRPKPYPWEKVALAILSGLLLCAGLVWTWRKYRKHKNAPPPPPEPAHHWAWRALEVLVNEQESGSLSNEIFVDRLSLILRTYIEKRYGIQAPEQTTEEFIARGVEQHSQLAEHKVVLTRFMEYADLIKFAKQSANAEDAQKGFDFLKSFIENTQEVEA
jgi:hypothetical protein